MKSVLGWVWGIPESNMYTEMVELDNTKGEGVVPPISIIRTRLIRFPLLPENIISQIKENINDYDQDRD